MSPRAVLQPLTARRPRPRAPRSILDDRQDAEIEIRAEPAIQPDLFFAACAPLFERAVVQEPKIDRLLYLVRVLARKEDARDVRLNDFDRLHGMRVGGRACEAGD